MKLSAIRLEQPIGEFYLAALPAASVLRIARVTRRIFDAAKLDTGGGLQRDPSERRVREIGEYCQTVDATFPTGVILAVPFGRYSLPLPEVEPGLPVTLELDDGESFASVVDGQHRLLGLKEAGAPADFMVPVVFMLSATEEQEALVFATINSKQTRVPASIVYDLFGVTKSRSPQKTSHTIARSLNADPESPWHRRLKMLGKSSEQSANESLTQGTFVRELLRHITTNASRDFDLARKDEALPVEDGPVFRSYFLRDEDDAIQRILENVFGAQKTVWPTQWSDPRSSILSKSTGFMATMWVLAELVAGGKKKRDLSKEFFVATFGRAKTTLEASGLTLTSENFSSSSPGIRQLGEHFVRALPDRS